jgi:tetratricopeptide (TPR) repeat protein
MTNRRGLAVLVGVIFVASMAEAQPSVWRLAADPEGAGDAQAIAEIDALAHELFALGRMGSVATRRLVLEKAQRVLEGAGAATSDDPRLRHHLAAIRDELFGFESDPAHLEAAIVHYRFAAESPRAPVLARAAAYNSLAICFARLGRHAEESEAYDRAIALQPDPDALPVLLANQAEGEMARGRIVEAVRGYRAALRATAGLSMLDSGVTTLWGFAVALDRAGDLPGALSQIAIARSYDPADVKLHAPTWFYVPEYDEAWYAALGHWQRARDAEDRLDRLEAYRDGEEAWRSFVSRARADDPWLPLASRRLAEMEREHRAFAARVPRAEREPAGD